MTVSDLSEASGVSVRTIKRMEAEPGELKSNFPNINAIRLALEAAGVEFIGTPDDAPGIRIHLPKTDQFE